MQLTRSKTTCDVTIELIRKSFENDGYKRKIRRNKLHFLFLDNSFYNTSTSIGASFSRRYSFLVELAL